MRVCVCVQKEKHEGILFCACNYLEGSIKTDLSASAATFGEMLGIGSRAKEEFRALSASRRASGRTETPWLVRHYNYRQTWDLGEGLNQVYHAARVYRRIRGDGRNTKLDKPLRGEVRSQS